MNGRIYAMPGGARRVRGAPPRRLGWRPWLIVLVLLILLVIAIPGLVNVLVTYWWFGELGYSSVYTTQIAATWALGLAGAAVAFAVIKALAFFVTRIARGQGRAQAYRGVVPLAVNGAILVLALLAGLGLSGDWQRALFALHQAPFGVRDPIFHHDVAFYIFTLPLLRDLLGWLGVILFLGLVVALVLLYVLDLGGRINQALEPYVRTGQIVGAPEFDVRWLRPYLTVLSFWLALVALLVAGSNWLMRYTSLVSPGNGFQGADYVDLHAGIPGWTILAALGVVAALVLLVNAFGWRRWLVVVGAVVLWLVAWLLLVGLYPAIVQGLQVNPAPLAAERAQIAHNIDATRAAYGLTGVTNSLFPADPISTSQVAAERASIDSLRVEDPDQFNEAAQQQQAIRLYYDLTAVGLDRYRIGGRLRQILIAPRELNQTQLPGNAQTWQNLNFTYTHGYGAVMAPVNTVASDGSPLYLIENIPPQRNPDVAEAADLPTITRPEIYFGEDTNNSVFVKTGAPEFDYDAGDTPVYRDYAGTAGIPIGGFLQRLAWMIYFASPIQVGTSSYLTSTSRVLLHRNIADRLATLAPFFTYDSDPYLVLDHAGRLMWIVDGYTTSTDYPYAEPYDGASVGSLAGISYMRNAIKATIDPYNGTVRLYVADPTDPVVRTIGNAFPGLLQPFSAMPADLRAHVRYPEDFFNVQTDVFARYHQTDAQSWYNNEDQWSIPTDGDGNRLAPYYAVTRLPGNTTDEFVLMRPYNPLNKNNMVSLLVGRSDAPHYGRLVVYRFPLGRQILGPQQFQANVQQKPAFSQDITLWNQQGSHVHFGNIIIVPVGRGLLYVEPLYLQAQSSRIPQLTRVIVYANGQLVWDYSLDRALEQIFGQRTPPPSGQAPGPVAGSGPVTGTARAILLQIQQHLIRAQEAYGRGDFTTYAREEDAVRQLLRAALGQR